MDDNDIGFSRTDTLLEHRSVLAPDNLLYSLANERFRDELAVVCSDLNNEETLLVIRTLEFSVPDQIEPVVFGKNIMRRSLLLQAEMIAHIAPLSVALSHIDAKHFGEWQCESVKAAVHYDRMGIRGRAHFDLEIAMASWRGYDRRGNIIDPRVNRALGHLLLLATFGVTAAPVGSKTSDDFTADEYEWFGANWERIVPIWGELAADKDFSHKHVESLFSRTNAEGQSAA